MKSNLQREMLKTSVHDSKTSGPLQRRRINGKSRKRKGREMLNLNGELKHRKSRRLQQKHRELRKKKREEKVKKEEEGRRREGKLKLTD